MKKLSTKVRVNEVSNIALRFIDTYATNPINDPHLLGFIDELRTLNQELVEAINPDFTRSNLEALDDVRDGYWADLFRALEGYSCLPIEPLRSSGRALFQIIQKFGRAANKKSYAEESTDIEAVLLDLSAPAVAAQVHALAGIPELINLLRQAQNDFHQAQMDFNQAHIREANRPSASTLKYQLINLINARFLPYLSAMQSVSPQTFDTFCSAIDGIITEMNGNVLRRKEN